MLGGNVQAHRIRQVRHGCGDTGLFRTGDRLFLGRTNEGAGPGARKKRRGAGGRYANFGPFSADPDLYAHDQYGRTVRGASTFEITGSCLGIGNTVSGADTGYFRIRDRTAGWNACWTGDPGTDVVTCKVSSWTNTGITFSGFTGGYGHNGWVITNGDHIQVEIWNPQSGKGPATCTGIAGRGAPTTC
jgi:hypothetical protein